MIINIIRVNFFISANYLPAVEKLNNGLNGRPFKLNENISTAKLIKINFSTFHNYIYLVIKLDSRLKILSILRGRY
jgi:hypothetical protein